MFVCLVTKAVHLEVVSALTTAACKDALKRFISRRGLPAKIMSDNGTNFVGTRNELEQLQFLLSDNSDGDSIASYVNQQGIQWVMIPPRAPHFGGLWEAAVKSMKHHLRRVVGTHRLTYEELNTILTQVEAILNSRPLTPLSVDANDLHPLTPGHFLVGGPLLALPEPLAAKDSQTPSKRFELLRALHHDFWQRWRKEYLSNLQTREKRKRDGAPIREGDVVLIVEDNVAPLQWPCGRIVKLIHGSDNIARVAVVKTVKGNYTKPIVKLRRLPTEQPAQPQ